MAQHGLWPSSSEREARERWLDGHGRPRVDMLEALGENMIDLTKAMEALLNRLTVLEHRVSALEPVEGKRRRKKGGN